ncbi:hypothetical protein J3F84DRAFT_378515 [Trichoderma pleuroticola]
MGNYVSAPIFIAFHFFPICQVLLAAPHVVRPVSSRGHCGHLVEAFCTGCLGQLNRAVNRAVSDHNACYQATLPQHRERFSKTNPNPSLASNGIHGKCPKARTSSPQPPFR